MAECFVHAARHEQVANALALGHLLVALLCLGLASGPLAAARLACWGYAAAAGLIATACWSLAAVARWRRRHGGSIVTSTPRPLWAGLLRDWLLRPSEARPAGGRWVRLIRLGRHRLERSVARHIGWSNARLAIGNLLVLVLIGLALYQAPNGEGIPSAWLACAVIGLLLGFVWLVLERHLVSGLGEHWPEAAALGGLLRGVLLFALLTAAAGLVRRAGLGWADWPMRIALLWLGLLSLELLLRALAAGFAPHVRHREPIARVQSLLAGCLGGGAEAGGRWSQRLRSQLGIDLRQSWALAYLGRAFWPVCAVILLLGWLLTALNPVAIGQRGLYERFGQPWAVWQPGLHLGLPWPFGRVRLIEHGQVHQLATGLVQGRDGQWQTATESEPTVVGAEAPAPPQADRLWDATHRAETVQLIASGNGEHASTQLVSLDVRLVYRLGLSDADALSVYRHDEPSGLLRRNANQVLLHYFASRELDNLLGAGLASVSQQLRSILQSKLDREASGIELLEVVVQAIHPPSGAAAAYHAVQAAEVATQARVVAERGVAATLTGQARQAATQARLQASAAAAEAVATAKADAITFQAERQAASQAGPAFLFERYLAQAERGLKGAPAVIIDHRIDAAGMPTIDLRPGSTVASDVTPARPSPH